MGYLEVAIIGGIVGGLIGGIVAFLRKRRDMGEAAEGRPVTENKPKPDGD